MSKKYYAADNLYSSETSVGFANTWFVIAFSSKKSRDQFVMERKGVAIRPIKRSEISRYTDHIKHFSGMRKAIAVNISPYDEYVEDIPGMIGQVINIDAINYESYMGTILMTI